MRWVNPVQRLLCGLSLVYVMMLVVWFGYVHGGLSLVLIPGAAPVLLWLYGAASYARVDSDGLRWRVYRPRRFAWSDIRAVTLDDDGTATVRVHDEQWPVMPTRFAGRDDSFLDAVVWEAGQHGVDVNDRRNR